MLDMPTLVGPDTTLLPDYCIVMEQGERSLLEAMNAENLSAEPKDLQRREILLTLCNILSYLHDAGYVHGDVKAHNVVRHTGVNVTWKAIDFDACTKIGGGSENDNGLRSPRNAEDYQRCGSRWGIDE